MGNINGIQIEHRKNKFQSFGQAIDWINRSVLIICNLMLVTSISTTLLQVFFRYILDASLSWPEELARILLMWITFLGSGVAVYHKGHAALTIFTNKLSKKIQFIISIVSHVIIICSMLILFKFAYEVMLMYSKFTTPGLHLNMLWFRAAIPAGLFLMFVNFIYRLVFDIKQYKNSD